MKLVRKSRLKTTWFLSTLVAAIALSSCGRANTIYSDGNGIVTLDDPNLPQGFFDQSINHGRVEISVASGGVRSLEFQIFAGANLPGGFVDSTATGNRAVLGISKYNHSRLADLAVAFDATSATSSHLHASVLVDLNCDGTQAVRTLRTDDLDSGVLADDAVWSVYGTAIIDGATTLLPSYADASRASLRQLIAHYPNACLRNDYSDGDESLPSLQMGSLQLSLGGVNATLTESISIKKLEINGDVYSKWNSQGQP